MEIQPKIVIFDLDGVLVDVRNSHYRTIIETIRYFTGRLVSRAEIDHWKSFPGYNDDCKLTHDWIYALGCMISCEEVTRKFHQLYVGDRFSGYIAGERWLLRGGCLKRLAQKCELALFTGRTRQVLIHTLEKFGVGSIFSRIVAYEDVKEHKPHPEGLLQILSKRDPRSALYVGDNIDDALAAQTAGIPFVGVLPWGSTARRSHMARLREMGAQALLCSVSELENWLRKLNRNYFLH